MNRKEVWAYYPFWLLAIAMVLLLYVPYLFTPGMHSDGVAYATISRNLAEGRGTLWKPFFTQTLLPEFYEHPPLVFGIESLFFKVLGDHMYVEKIYAFVCFLISTLFLFKIWAVLTGDKVNAWIFFIYWVAIPEVPYDYAANYLENTMGIFCFAACFIILRYFISGTNRASFIVLSALLIFLGCLCKGPFALFPLALPGVYWLSFRRISPKAAFLTTLYLSIALIICFSILILWPAAKHNLFTYLSGQVVASIEGKRSLPGNRFFVLNTLIYKLKPIYFTVPVILFIGLVFGKKAINKPYYRISLFFFLMALTVNLPVMISPKQFEQYILCAYAFYAMAAASLVAPYFKYWIERFIVPFPAVYLSLMFIMAFTVIGTGYYAVNDNKEYSIDGEILKDVQGLKPYVSQNSVLPVCNGIDGEWPLRGLLYKEYHISVSGEDTTKTYLLTSEGCHLPAPTGYTEIFAGSKYLLWARGKSK